MAGTRSKALSVMDIQFYEDETGSEPCREWIDKLGNIEREAILTAIELVLAERGTDVCQTEFGKNLGQGLYEFRLRWTAEEVKSKVGRVSDAAAEKSAKILLRVFFCTGPGRKIILLLSGYDKGKDPSGRRQQREIVKARKLYTAHCEALKRGRKQA
ncbi:MAG TPA: hypothetical protein VJT16_24720 [Streptosporangiaceae bacterium]|nr:hypothetical protein [Streptosporangiaceae bacterium]